MPTQSRSKEIKRSYFLSFPFFTIEQICIEILIKLNILGGLFLSEHNRSKITQVFFNIKNTVDLCTDQHFSNNHNKEGLSSFHNNEELGFQIM